MIFIPGYYTDVGNIAIQARKLGIKVPLLGGDGWDSAKLAEIGGDAINGCFYSNHYSHQDPTRTFRSSSRNIRRGTAVFPTVWRRWVTTRRASSAKQLVKQIR